MEEKGNLNEDEFEEVITFPKCQDADDDTWTISLDDPMNDLRYVENPDDMVILTSRIVIVYSYPFKQPFPFEELAPNDKEYFTRFDLVMAISNRYKNMYDEEEQSSGNRTINRGPYGIWGHFLSELRLVSVERQRNGNYYLTVDS